MRDLLSQSYVEKDFPLGRLDPSERYPRVVLVDVLVLVLLPHQARFARAAKITIISNRPKFDISAELIPQY